MPTQARRTDKPTKSWNRATDKPVTIEAPAIVPSTDIKTSGDSSRTLITRQLLRARNALIARVSAAPSTTAWVGGRNMASTGTADNANPKPVNVRSTAATRMPAQIRATSRRSMPTAGDNASAGFSLRVPIYRCCQRRATSAR